MSAPDRSRSDVANNEAAGVARVTAGRLVGDGVACFRAAIVARATEGCAAPSVLQGGADPAEGADLVKLAEDLQAAIENDDVRLARQAHGALGKQLERGDGRERVVDLARERARRRRVR